MQRLDVKREKDKAMPEFECFVSGATGNIVEAETAEAAREIYFEMLKSELTVNDVIAVEMDCA